MKQYKDTIPEILVKNPVKRRSPLVIFGIRLSIVIGFVVIGVILRFVMGYTMVSEQGLLWTVIPVVFGLSIVLSVRKMNEWERGIIFRFGRFSRVKGPGLFLLVPLAEQIASIVDLRIRVSDFTTQNTLTRDSVTVTVDALCFWLVWDPEKAICEVQDYEAAVILSAKTALRSAVSSHDLTLFLEKGDVIEQCIREEVDRKTTEWGITVQHIEITDIQIPEALQDSLSRLAQAEREKMSRVLLAEAEIAIAERLTQAGQLYSGSDTAFSLKKLTILNEGLKAGNSMMLVPNSITEGLDSTDVFGLEALHQIKQEKQKEHTDDSNSNR